MATQILNRRGTAAAWALANPVLGDGELGFETDTKIIKVGDGSTSWNSLTVPYLSAGGGTMTGDLDMDGSSIHNQGVMSNNLNMGGNTIDNLGAMPDNLDMAGNTIDNLGAMPDNLDMGGNRATGLGAPTADNDAVRRSYSDGGYVLTDVGVGDDDLYIMANVHPEAVAAKVILAGTASGGSQAAMTFDGGVTGGTYIANSVRWTGTADYSVGSGTGQITCIGSSLCEFGILVVADIWFGESHNSAWVNGVGRGQDAFEMPTTTLFGGVKSSAGSVSDVRFRASTGETWEPSSRIYVYSTFATVPVR